MKPMIYKIKMKKDDYFKISKRIISANLEIEGEEVSFEIEGGSFQILKKSNYPYKLIESLQSRIARYLSKYSLVIVGVLFLLSILYMNIFRVSKITFNRETPINDEIEEQISSSFKKLFCFDFCNIDYEAFSKKLRLQYPQYPYIKASFDHNVIDVTIYNYDEVSIPIENQTAGDVIAKKDGIVDIFYVFNGQSLVSKNKYVKSGDVLISGNSTNTLLQAGGLIMATTYEKMTIEVPKEEIVSSLSSETDRYHHVKLFNWGFDLSKDANFSSYQRNEVVKFNLFDIFTVKEIADTKKNDIIKTYDEETAQLKAQEMILEDFKEHQINSLEKVLAMVSIKCEEEDNRYIFTFIVKKNESIGVFQGY